MRINVLDLFSGIGGFSLGLERAGFKTVAFCEIEDYPRKILKKHWPKVKIYNDITSAKFTEDVDLVAAGFPCQDISLAGKSAGLSGDRSGLFWYIIRALCMVGRPKVLLENVAALLNRGMGVVLGALASFGYDAEWHCIPACSVGAEHERDRIWIYAHSNSERKLQQERIEQNKRGWVSDSSKKITADTDSTRLSGRMQTTENGKNEANIIQGLGLAQPFEARISRDYWNHQPILGRRLHGIPNRVDRIKGLGNAVVPQIPEIIGRAINHIQEAL